MSLHDNFLTSTAVSYPETVEVPDILNTHTHPRDTDVEKDGRAEIHIPLLAEVYSDALGIGNTQVPLTTAALAAHKKNQWNFLVPQGSKLRIHVAGIMTEKTDPEDVVRGYDKPNGHEDWLGMKMFLRAVSNSHGADVDDVSKMIPVLKAMTHARFVHKKRPMALSIHAERKFTQYGKRIQIMHRERAAIDRDLPYILKEVPEAYIIICHISDAATIEAVRYYRKQGFHIWGEICPQYTIWTHDDLFEGPGGGTMFDAHKFCVPIFKTEEDRRAIRSAMLSGEDCWIFGTDEACHLDNPGKPQGVKINSLGYVVPGQTQVPKATVSYVIEQACEAQRLDILSGFLSHNGRAALGLPPALGTTRFRKYDWTVQETVHRLSPTLGNLSARVAMSGQLRHYLPEAELAA